MACCTGMGSVSNLCNLCCKSVGKSVHWGHCEPKTTSGIDMHDPGALDDAAVVWPHNDNYPLPSTDTFRMVPVHGSCCVGLGSSGSTGLHLNLALTINLIPPGNSSINVGGGWQNCCCYSKKVQLFELKSTQANEKDTGKEGGIPGPTKKYAVSCQPLPAKGIARQWSQTTTNCTNWGNPGQNR